MPLHLIAMPHFLQPDMQLSGSIPTPENGVEPPIMESFRGGQANITTVKRLISVLPVWHGNPYFRGACTLSCQIGGICSSNINSMMTAVINTAASSPALLWMMKWMRLPKKHWTKAPSAWMTLLTYWHSLTMLETMRTNPYRNVPWKYKTPTCVLTAALPTCSKFLIRK